MSETLSTLKFLFENFPLFSIQTIWKKEGKDIMLSFFAIQRSKELRGVITEKDTRDIINKFILLLKIHTQGTLRYISQIPDEYKTLKLLKCLSIAKRQSSKVISRPK